MLFYSTVSIYAVPFRIWAGFSAYPASKETPAEHVRSDQHKTDKFPVCWDNWELVP